MKLQRAAGERAARRVRILVAGGTIGMTGDAGATPMLDGAELIGAVPGLGDREGIESENVVNVPSAHLTLDDQLRICRTARDAARKGIGVVVTHGTDTLEETAMLADVVHDAEAPIVFTGAIRTASAAGADGPANLGDAVSVARQRGGRGARRARLLRRRNPSRALRAQDRHHIAGGVLVTPDRPARARDRGPPNDLVARAAQPAARPAKPEQARAGGAHHQRATTARSPAPRWRPSPTAR